MLADQNLVHSRTAIPEKLPFSAQINVVFSQKKHSYPCIQYKVTHNSGHLHLEAL